MAYQRVVFVVLVPSNDPLEERGKAICSRSGWQERDRQTTSLGRTTSFATPERTTEGSKWVRPSMGSGQNRTDL